MDYRLIAKWLLSRSTGASAKAIVCHITGLAKCEGDYPHDGGDFGRCERMMDMIPGIRERLPEMATANKYWAALIPRWDEIKSTNQEAQYNKIQSIVRGIEKSDPNVVRIGDGVTIRFGKI